MSLLIFVRNDSLIHFPAASTVFSCLSRVCNVGLWKFWSHHGNLEYRVERCLFSPVCHTQVFVSCETWQFCHFYTQSIRHFPSAFCLSCFGPHSMIFMSSCRICMAMDIWSKFSWCTVDVASRELVAVLCASIPGH